MKFKVINTSLAIIGEGIVYRDITYIRCRDWIIRSVWDTIPDHLQIMEIESGKRYIKDEV